MPKDPSKQGHRGIGFVTYASPESGAPRFGAHCLACLLGNLSQHHVAFGWRGCCSGLRTSFKSPPARFVWYHPWHGSTPNPATLSCPAVELVMGQTHVLNGNEIAIDRATPKEKTALLPGRLRCAHAFVPLRHVVHPHVLVLPAWVTEQVQQQQQHIMRGLHPAIWEGGPPHRSSRAARLNGAPLPSPCPAA